MRGGSQGCLPCFNPNSACAHSNSFSLQLFCITNLEVDAAVAKSGWVGDDDSEEGSCERLPLRRVDRRVEESEDEVDMASAERWFRRE